MTRAESDARRALRMAGRQGIRVQVIDRVILLSGAAPYVCTQWRPVLERHRDAIVRLLGAPAAAGPAQQALPGVVRK
jgi:hypothetical protein